MKRREVIKRTMFASGALLSAPLYSALLSGCSTASAPETNFTPAAFNEEQYSLLEAMADTLLPETDTPSATQAGAVQVIDSIVGECYSPAERNAYFELYEVLEKELEGFRELSAKKQLARLEELENADGKVYEAWLHVKQQVIAMYLTSELVAENTLNYLPVPGSYESCIPMSETNGKAWAI